MWSIQFSRLISSQKIEQNYKLLRDIQLHVDRMLAVLCFTIWLKDPSVNVAFSLKCSCEHAILPVDMCTYIVSLHTRSDVLMSEVHAKVEMF